MNTHEHSIAALWASHNDRYVDLTVETVFERAAAHSSPLGRQSSGRGLADEVLGPLTIFNECFDLDDHYLVLTGEGINFSSPR
jgi:hypothetical protein